METINLMTPEQLYEKCPLLEDIKIRLADSETEAQEINESQKQKIESIRKENKKNPDSIHLKRVPAYQTRYKDDYRITQILKDTGKWDDVPTRTKHGGAKEFEADIVTLASTRGAKGFKIVIYKGRNTHNKQQCEQFVAYLTPEAKEADKSDLSGAEPNPDDKFLQLHKKIDGLSKTNSETFNPAVMKLEFSLELKELEHRNQLERLKSQHEQAIKELEKEHEETIKEYQSQIDELAEEVEESNAKILELDGELGSTADLLQQKHEPSLVTIGSAILKKIGGELITMPEIQKGISQLTNMSVEELKGLIAQGKQRLTENTSEEKTDASVTFDTPKDEYEGFSEPHATVLKNLHEVQKGLSQEELKIVYSICCFCFVSGTAQFHPQHAQLLLEFITPIIEKENNQQ